MILWLTVILLLFWGYRLWSVYSPGWSFYAAASQKSDLVRASMALFMIIPFFQCRIASWSWKFPYSEIFFQLCRNIFLLFQASIVIAVFWGLLITAGLLFDIAGMELVPYIIFNPLVAVPLSSLVIAISISVAIKHPGIDSLGRWVLSVMGWILPATSIISLSFIACLPYTLFTLLESGQTGSLMLMLQGTTLILTNTAFTDGTTPAFKSHALNITATIPAMLGTVYATIAAASISMRLHQYGLTPDRLQAVYLTATASLWTIGYAGAVVMGKWPRAIGKVNVFCAAVTCVITMLMNTPLLDPLRLSASNQLARLSQGIVQPQDFDYVYMRYSLGRYGYEVLSELSHSTDERIRQGVLEACSVSPEEYREFMRSGLMPEVLRRKVISTARVYPSDRKLSAEQQEYFVHHWEYFDGVRKPQDLSFVFAQVLKGEEALLSIREDTGYVFSLKPEYIGSFTGKFSPSSLDVNVIAPQVQDVLVNGTRYRIIW